MKRFLFFVLAVVCEGGVAADAASMQRCREMRDGAARLACYDAIPFTTKPDERAPPVPAAPIVPAATFGLESRPTAAVLPTPLASIESAIDGLFEGWLPRSQLRLANGQVWEVTDGSQAAYDLKSPKVKITRGVSGSFFIAIEGVSQTPRVRRVK